MDLITEQINLLGGLPSFIFTIVAGGLGIMFAFLVFLYLLSPKTMENVFMKAKPTRKLLMAFMSIMVFYIIFTVMSAIVLNS